MPERAITPPPALPPRCTRPPQKPGFPSHGWSRVGRNSQSLLGYKDPYEQIEGER